MPKNLKLNYVEFPAKDIPATKRFFEDAFGWSFTDYGDDYTAFRILFLVCPLILD